MFKTLFLLIRGSAASAAEEIADRNALLILDQQMREAGAAIERAKRALALAIAQDGAEAKRLDAAIARIADLEVRVKAALEAGNEGIAREGAEAIAALEADRDAAQAARTLFASEIARLRTLVIQAEQRLTALDRGGAWRARPSPFAPCEKRRSRKLGRARARCPRPKRRSNVCASVKPNRWRPMKRWRNSTPR